MIFFFFCLGIFSSSDLTDRLHQAFCFRLREAPARPEARGQAQIRSRLPGTRTPAFLADWPLRAGGRKLHRIRATCRSLPRDTADPVLPVAVVLPRVTSLITTPSADGGQFAEAASILGEASTKREQRRWKPGPGEVGLPAVPAAAAQRGPAGPPSCRHGTRSAARAQGEEEAVGSGAAPE